MLLIANYSQFVGKKQVSGRFLDYFANLHNHLTGYSDVVYLEFVIGSLFFKVLSHPDPNPQ